ncbi:DNA methyltransferase [Xylanibacter oryzae]|uniref:DNA methyltransferase n=1 Tax=Xylanibacter oryzae TaxID=185293 RepID=UPI0004AC7191|nr:DNA methyltransferase [Xylanibacter oryzae]
MAKKQNLSYQDIETSLEVLKERRIHSSEVGYVILKAFGKSDADIRRYREGKGILSTYKGLLIKGLFGYKPVNSTELTSALEGMKLDPKVIKAAPKIVAVSDGETILAYDMREKESYENPLARLYCDFAFFYPLCGVERFVSVGENPADVKAAEKLAKLHDELRAYNEFSSKSELHDLNIFIARLLFCFFAEDTGIFENNLFTGSIVRYTKENGSDLADYLDAAFNVMDIKERNEDTMKIISQFPYVNGGLFSKHIQIPKMGYKARKIIIECGELDWQNINPDIFGSMIQAVVDPSVRANQGMHYTSVPNIMKVINPLFMDELREEYNKENEEYRQNKQLKEMGALSNKDFATKCQSIVKKSNALLSRMSKMKFFDPACGSGNFLIITYKSLRFLEMDILKLQQECEGEGNISAIMGSCINLRQFYGIELLDFPHEVAMLSLWLAQHQMDNKLFETFGVNTQALPLHNITQIQCGNACRLDWNVVCPHEKDDEVFVFGNPPYLGSRNQGVDQKSDIKYVIGDKGKSLDYISCWFYLANKFIEGYNAKYAFVSTNSICQGEQVAILWEDLLKTSQIFFAYQSFKWSNNAKYNAGVTVVVIGVEPKEIHSTKTIYNDSNKVEVEKINPYLLPGSSSYIHRNSSPLSADFPVLRFGSMANDGGQLVLDTFEKNDLLQKYPQLKFIIHSFIGSQEFINGQERWCLYMNDDQARIFSNIEEISKKLDLVREHRNKSSEKSTRLLAAYPNRFYFSAYKETESIIIPRVSSERREYIPIGYLNKDTIASDSAFAIYDAETWLFGILESKMHMAWVRTVGGKLKTDYRYSAQLCYNTFPFPKITDEKRAELTNAAEEVLITRAGYPEKTLAEMYDPDKMPQDLREAHNALDDIVDSCYPGYPFANDEARLECLFRLYEKMTSK